MRFREEIRWGSSDKGGTEVIGNGVTEGARLAAGIAWKPALLTPSLVLISTPWCLHFPGKAGEGEGGYGELGGPSL